MTTPQTAKLTGSPQNVKFGCRVSSTTTSNGMKKIRRTVRLFGRFIKHPDRTHPSDAFQAVSNPRDFTIDSRPVVVNDPRSGVPRTANLGRIGTAFGPEMAVLAGHAADIQAKFWHRGFAV